MGKVRRTHFGIVVFVSAIINGPMALCARSDELDSSCAAIPDALHQLHLDDASNNAIPRMNTALFEQHQGKRIENIEITVNDIFDLSNPDENKPLFRMANRLQVNTQKNVIKTQLLFKEGEPLNSQKVNESLRVLFSRQYLLQAQAIITHACDDRVSIRVIVKDAWGIKPAIAFSSKGGEKSSTLGMSDTNFLGTGYQVAFAYEKDPNGNALSYFLRTDNFLRNNYRLDITHTELSEGQSGRFALQKPFIGLNSDWAYGVESTHDNQERIIRWQDEVIDRYAYDERSSQIFIGKSIAQTGLSAWRLRAGLTDYEETLGDNGAMRFEHQNAWLSLEKTTSYYRQYQNLHFIQQVDDVPLESQMRVQIGVGQDAEGHRIHLLNMRYQRPLVATDHHLWQMALTSRWLDQFPDDQWSVRLDSQYYAQINDHQRWAIRAHWQQQHAPQPHQQLVLGELSGLRGYPNNFQRGAQRLVFSIERRYYSDWHPWNLLRLGALVFWDTGRVWGERTNLIGQPDSPEALQRYNRGNSGKLLSSVGLGLRLHSSKSGTPAVVHFNIGFPLVREKGANIGRYGFSASAERRF